VEPQTGSLITSAIAPVVMVSATGLLFMSVQAKNLHLADRLRALAGEYRALTAAGSSARSEQIARQLPLFERRIRLSQRALDLLYLALVCFVLTSLLLAATRWLGGLARLAPEAGLFVLGVGFLLAALIAEYLEMRVGLETIAIETEDLRPRR
jgi:hypothetical protein